MFEEIKQIFAKQLKIDETEITMDSKIIEDLGADSLDILEVLMTMESDYGMTIPDESLAKFVTVGDIVTYIDENK